MSLFNSDEIGREEMPNLETSNNHVECTFCENLFVPDEEESSDSPLCWDCVDHLLGAFEARLDRLREGL